LPDSVAGIAGLATDADDKWGPNLVKSLRNNGVLSDAVFGFYLSRIPTVSFLDLGAIINSHMADSTNLYMMDIVDESTHWALDITGIGFGDMDQNAYRIKGEALLDTGTTCIVVPPKYYLWFMEKLAE